MTTKRNRGKSKPKPTYCEYCQLEFNSHDRCERCGQVVGKYKTPLIIEGYLTADMKEVTEDEHYGGSNLIDGLCKYCKGGV